MKKIFTALLIALFSLGAFATTSMANDLDIYKNSPEAKDFFKASYGYAFFPNVGKGGLGVGLSYGEGNVYKMGKKTGKVTLLKASIGLQAGVQAFSELIFFEDKNAYDEFTTGQQFEFDATASAAAITAGAQASSGTKGSSASLSAGPATTKQVESKARFQRGIRVFIHVKGGLMYEATIGGQQFTFAPI